MAFFPRKPKPRQKVSAPGENTQKIDRIYYLSRCALFKSLNEWQIRSISKCTRLAEIKRGEHVYRAGGEGKAFYIVISGRFEAYIEKNGKKQILAYLKQGAYFGEMSLISNHPHSANVCARSDSLVLKISKEDFHQIVENNATIALEISRVLSERIKTRNAALEAKSTDLLSSDVVSIVNFHRSGAGEAFSINLAAALDHETRHKVVLVDMSPTGRAVSDKLHVSAALPKRFFSELGEDLEKILKEHLFEHKSGIHVLSIPSKEANSHSASFMTHLLNRLAVDFRFVLVDLPEYLDDAVINILNHSDVTFVVTDNNLSGMSEAQERIHVLDKTISAPDEKIHVVMIESILGYTPSIEESQKMFGKKNYYLISKPPEAAGNMAELKDKQSWEEDNSQYTNRMRYIARKISHNLVGLALGSGAALGFSHIGVLKVFRREGIPIDYVAGSSMGALIAAFFATGKTPEEMQDLASQMGPLRLAKLADIAIFPWRGLVKGKRLMKFLNQFLQDATFEQAKIPLLLVGTNIQNREIAIMKSGPILPALRASIAIPGIFHPVRIGEENMIDGGILDPLPIRPLIDAGVDKVIAVDVLPTPRDIAEKRRFDERVRVAKDAMIAKKGFVAKGMHQFKKKMNRILMPNSIDIVVNSIQAMEHLIAEAESSDADVLIRPNMSHIHWAEFHRHQELIERGEEAAEAALTSIRALIKQQNI